MEFYDVIRSRRSVRAYKGDAIPQDSLRRIAEAASLAPSACNLQPWRFMVVINKDLREAICRVYDREWMRQAPAIVAALGNYESCWKRLDGKPAVDIDVGIAMEHVVLAAAAEGLATCWICAYDVERMNKALRVESPWSVLAISPLGFAAKTPAAPERKSVSETFEVVE